MKPKWIMRAGKGGGSYPLPPSSFFPRGGATSTRCGGGNSPLWVRLSAPNRWKEMEKGNLTFGADSGGATAQSLSVPQTPEGIFMENLDYRGGE